MGLCVGLPETPWLGERDCDGLREREGEATCEEVWEGDWVAGLAEGVTDAERCWLGVSPALPEPVCVELADSESVVEEEDEAVNDWLTVSEELSVGAAFGLPVTLDERDDVGVSAGLTEADHESEPETEALAVLEWLGVILELRLCDSE